MTLTEKILARHAGKKKVSSGEFVECNVDIALGNDITAPLAVEKFRKIGSEQVFDREKVVFVCDHFTPSKDIRSASNCLFLREFARTQNLRYFYDGGKAGIEHVLLPEEGLILPAELAIGADSHTCTYGALGAFATGVGSTDLAYTMATGKCWFRVPSTVRFLYQGKLKKWVTGKDLILYTISRIGVDGASYKTMEFSGPIIESLSMAERFTMCNMAIEAGAKNGIIEPDQLTYQWIEARAKHPYEPLTGDGDVEEVIEYDCSQVDLQVSVPPLPSHARAVEELKDVTLDQVVIGSCTNGRLDDLRLAAKILSGKKVHPSVRLLILPATPHIVYEAVKEGLIEIFLSAGAVVTPPSCGPCLGGHLGVLAKGERALATTNRNFVGRMGHPESEVYLSGVPVAAASAIAGRIIHPDEVT